jgi:hypothetical protein
MIESVCSVVELPETLHNLAISYVDSHQGWSVDRLHQAALSLFLMQNANDREAAKTYLSTMFSDDEN